MPKTLTSRDNPLLKTMRLVAAQARMAPPELVLAEGTRTLEEATRAGWPIESVLMSENFASSPRGQCLLQAWSERKVRLFAAREAILGSVSDVVAPQGAVALVRVPAVSLDLMKLSGNPLILVAVGIQDPGNLGTLVRTAAAAGCSFVCCLRGTVSARNPKVIRASAGTYFRIPIVESATITQFSSFCGSRGIRIYRSSAHDGPVYSSVSLRSSCAILLGNEGSGIPADEWGRVPGIRIPMAPGIESLNVAAAGAILLFEASRQRTSCAAEPTLDRQDRRSSDWAEPVVESGR